MIEERKAFIAEQNEHLIGAIQVITKAQYNSRDILNLIREKLVLHQRAIDLFDNGFYMVKEV